MQTRKTVRSRALRRPVGVEQRVLARCRALALPTGTPVVVAFSGGGDSLALAAILARIAAAAAVRPLLVHVDHALRPASGDEGRRAEALAAALGVPFRTAQVPAGALDRHPGVGPEEAARRERYRLLAASAREAGAALVALAHHRDDQAETVLLHLLRGAGLGGAAGMAERAELVVPWWAEPGAATTYVALWRPLLGEPRAVVRAYAARTGLVPNEDPSNGDRALRRNALRHEALPLLERLAPGAAAALARFARLAAEDDAALEGMAVAALARAATSDGGLHCADLAAEPLAVRRRVVRRWLRLWIGAGEPELSADRVEAVLSLLVGAGGRRIEVGGGWSAATEGGALRLVRNAPAAEANEGGRA